MIKKLGALLAVTLAGSATFSQSVSTSITGRIIDAETGAPVAFVNVVGHGSGASTNQTGKFAITPSTPVDTLFSISCIGYETLKKSKRQIEKENIIKLTSKAETLKEVVVYNISPIKILQKAQERLERNFQGSEFSSGFTLNQFIFNESEDLIGHCNTFGLMNHRFIDSTKTFPKIRIDSITASIGFIKHDTTTGKKFNVFSSRSSSLSPYFFLEVVEPVRYFLGKEPFSEKFFEGMDVTLEGIYKINGENHYYISAIPKANAPRPHFEGYFLINAKDFGPRSIILKAPQMARTRTHVSVSYEKRKSKFVISSMDVLLTKLDDKKSSKEIKGFYFSSFQFTDIKTKGMEWIKPKQVIKKTAEPHYQLIPIKVVQDQPNNLDWETIKKGKFLEPMKE